jgi:hypothetical protein
MGKGGRGQIGRALSGGEFKNLYRVVGLKKNCFTSFSII